MAAFKQQTTVEYASTTEPTAVQKQVLDAYTNNSFYDEATIKILEGYLDEQLKTSVVDIDADLALLKLYVVYPLHSNADKVAKVLVKGIMSTPSSFFTGAAAMVLETLREDANVQAVLSAGFLLQSCLFEEFWKADLTFAKTVPGFVEAVRAFILDAIRRSHNSISTSVLKAKLNISDKEVASVVEGEKWTVEGDVIKITLNQDNQVRPKKIQENIEFEDVLKVIHTLSR